jgi:hypothetical protein
MKKAFTLFMVLMLGSVVSVAQNESLEPGGKVTITNPEFDEGSYGTDGWTRSGSFSKNGQYYDNYYLGCSSKSFNLSQSLTGLPNGIYLLKVTGCDRIRQNDTEAMAAYDPSINLNTYIYINDAKSDMKNIFDDEVVRNIYLENNESYFTTKDGLFVPSAVQSVNLAFVSGLYENYVVGVVTDGSLTIGIGHSDDSRYTYIDFDKFEVTYLMESTDINEYATNLLTQKMSPAAKTALTASIEALAAAKETENETAALADFYNKLGKAETSARTFAKLNNSITVINNAVKDSQSKWTTTISEAEKASTDLTAAYNNESLTDNEAVNAIIGNGKIVDRLSYSYLDITVNTPGSMGDSILKYVDFVDVQSLKLRGKLNSDDIYSLKNRLTSLLEIDLSDLDWPEIPADQFNDKTLLERVILPNNVKKIGNNAFYNCRKLQSVEFPSTLESIGTYAFYRTYNFRDIVLPEGLNFVDNYAFCDSRLTSVTFPSTLKTIKYESFYNCDNLSSIVFNDQTTIESYAFASCEALTKLKFPNSLYFIGSYAFSGARSLETIDFNEGLYQIEDNAFNSCDSLKEVTLPSTLVHANPSPFDNCDKLMKVTCLSIEPPLMTDQIPYGKSMEGRELYVPALSLNVYKQTTGWDKFQTIKPIDSYPENIVIYSDYKLDWPDDLNKDYEPNVTLSSTNDQKSYGSLSVNGNSTLSVKLFTMRYDPNATRRDYFSVDGRYQHKRFAYTALVNNAHTRADNIITELYLRKNTWEFLTFPYDVKVSDIRFMDEEVPFVIRKYDGKKRADGLTDETWVDMTPETTLEAGVGYIWRSANGESREYNGFYLDALQSVNKNNMFINEDIEIPLSKYESEFEHNRSWNLIGNPYPCFYDTRAMQTSAPITVWNTYYNNYDAYSPVDDSYILNPGQAFFVQCPVDESSIKFLKEGRQVNLTVRDIAYNSARARSAKSPRSVFNLLLTGNGQGDRTRFVINENASLDYETSCDASKFMSLEQQSAQLYTMEQGVRMAINERPIADGVIKLGLQVAADDLYTISLDTKVENDIYLVDYLTGTKTLLNNTEGYTFNSEAGTFESRFAIVLGSGSVTGIKTLPTTDADSNASIYDLQGRRISQPQKGVYLKNGKKVVIK